LVLILIAARHWKIELIERSIRLARSHGELV